MIERLKNIILQSCNLAILQSLRQRGFAALPVLLMIGALVVEVGVVGAAMLFLKNTSLLKERAASDALFTARAGADDGLIQITRNKSFSSSGYTVSVGSNTSSVTVEQNTPASGEDSINSSSTVRAVTKAVQVIVNVDVNGQINVVSYTEKAN